MKLINNCIPPLKTSLNNSNLHGVQGENIEEKNMLYQFLCTGTGTLWTPSPSNNRVLHLTP